MQRTLLSELSALVPNIITPGLNLSEVLTPLHARLNDAEIPAGRLTIDGAASTNPVPQCILLCDASVLRTPLDEALLHLSGCGPQYNGMLDRCAKDLPGALLRRVAEETRPAATAERSVGLCLRVLNAAYGTLTPDVALAVQQHLNDILLRSPVLMHPAILVPAVVGQKTEFVGIAAALATSRHGALPRYCHYFPDETPTAFDGLKHRETATALVAFARHPCVRFALSSNGRRIVAGETTGDRFLAQVKAERLHAPAVRAFWPRAAFLGSLMETEELAFPRFRTADRLLPFWASIAEGAQWQRQVLPLLASSVTAAAGALHSSVQAGSHGWSPFHHRDPWFLQAIKSRLPLLLGRASGLDQGVFGHALVAGLQRRLFLAGGSSVPLDLIEENLGRVVRGLVEAGMFSSVATAGDFVIEHSIGSKRPDGHLPGIDAAGALAFFAGLDKLGLLGVPGTGSDVRAIDSLSASIEGDPGRAVAHRSEWLAAASALRTERVMSAILNAPQPDVAADALVAPLKPQSARRSPV